MRHKATWVASQSGSVYADESALVIPAKLQADPDRVVLVRIPRSQTTRLILAQINATEALGI